MIRLAFIRDVNRRFNAVKRDIHQSIIDNDCFGIQPDVPRILTALPNKTFEFKQSVDKIAGFMRWLEEQEQLGILELVYRPGFASPTNGVPWAHLYIDSAYHRGLRNAESWLQRAKYGIPTIETLPGGIRRAMRQPIHAQRIAVIYSRTYEDLKSVTQVMNAQIRRKITDGLTTGLARGLAEGKSPRVIARELFKDVANRVDKIGIVRARAIARTEVLNAHNDAQMAEYQQAEKYLGEPMMVDVNLGGNPCEICIDLEAGGPYELTRAMGQLPAHPNCVCVHIPVVKTGAKEN